MEHRDATSPDDAAVTLLLASSDESSSCSQLSWSQSSATEPSSQTSLLSQSSVTGNECDDDDDEDDDQLDLRSSDREERRHKSRKSKRSKRKKKKHRKARDTDDERHGKREHRRRHRRHHHRHRHHRHDQQRRGRSLDAAERIASSRAEHEHRFASQPEPLPEPVVGQDCWSPGAFRVVSRSAVTQNDARCSAVATSNANLLHGADIAPRVNRTAVNAETETAATTGRSIQKDVAAESIDNGIGTTATATSQRGIDAAERPSIASPHHEEAASDHAAVTSATATSQRAIAAAERASIAEQHHELAASDHAAVTLATARREVDRVLAEAVQAPDRLQTATYSSSQRTTSQNHRNETLKPLPRSSFSQPQPAAAGPVPRTTPEQVASHATTLVPGAAPSCSNAAIYSREQPLFRVPAASNSQQSTLVPRDRPSAFASFVAPSRSSGTGRRSLPQLDQPRAVSPRPSRPRTVPLDVFPRSVGRPVAAYRNRNTVMPSGAFRLASSPTSPSSASSSSSSPFSSSRSSSPSRKSGSKRKSTNGATALNEFVVFTDESNDTTYSKRARLCDDGSRSESGQTSPTSSTVTSGRSSTRPSPFALKSLRAPSSADTEPNRATPSCVPRDKPPQPSSSSSFAAVAATTELDVYAARIAASQPNGSTAIRRPKPVRPSSTAAVVRDGLNFGGYDDDDSRSQFPTFPFEQRPAATNVSSPRQLEPPPPSPTPSLCSVASSGARSVARITSRPAPAASFSPCSSPSDTMNAFQPVAPAITKPTQFAAAADNPIMSRIRSALSVSRSSSTHSRPLEPPSDDLPRVDDSQLTAHEASTWRSLPNDSCPETARAEQRFLHELGAVPYRAFVDASHAVERRSVPVTVISSRVTRLRYSLPQSARLDADVFRAHFERTGHTLAVDYSRSYARPFALDIDCACRCRATDEHLDDRMIRQIMQQTLRVFARYDPERTLRCEVWRNRCGYHLYTDAAVSLPTHVNLAEWVAGQFAHLPCIIEVPDEMPLPYSAKRPGQPYTFAFATTERPTLVHGNVPSFLELYDWILTECVTPNDTSVLSVACDTGDSWTAVLRERPVRLSRVPALPRQAARATLLLERFVQLQRYVEHRIRYRRVATSSVCDDHALNARLTPSSVVAAGESPCHGERALQPHQQHRSVSESPVSHVTFAPGFDDEYDGEVQLLPSHELRDRVRDFFRHFNQKFFQVADNTSCRGFLELVLNPEHGGLWLQPYVVAMHKWLSPISMDDMRLVLRAVLSSYSVNDPLLARFVSFYDEHTSDCYHESADSMLDHLLLLQMCKITPFDDLDATIDAMLAVKLEVADANAFKKLVAAKKKLDEKMELRTKAIDAYAEVLRELRVVVRNRSSDMYYVSNGDGYTMHASIAKHLPRCIRAWVGGHKSVVDNITLQVEADAPTINEDELFTISHFLFSTSVGVFNSLTSMYTAKTRFLRFTCYRKTAIWLPGREERMYAEQNRDVLEWLVHCEPIVRRMLEDPGEMFTHFLLAPAILQLDHVGFIEEAWISRCLRILGRYPSLEHAYFLLDYYPIDPAYVLVIMHLCNKYGGASLFSSYRRLEHQVLEYEAGSRAAWSKRLLPIYESASYDEHAATYMDALLSLRGDGVTQVSDKFAFTAWLIALLLTKTTHHEKLVSAVYRPQRNLTRREHPAYRDFEPCVDEHTSRRNKERAARIVFGEETVRSDGRLLDTMFSLGMSAFFDPANTIELLSSLSFMFVPYNRHKKLFLFYGYGNNGKSFLCNLIQGMTLPKNGRYQNLSAAMERSNVTLKNSVTILNEIHRVDPSKIKTVTGNDPESTKVFYSQVYEMCRSQSLIYGATNNVVLFRGETMADKATVDRFHVIKLHGRQVSVERTSSSLFQLFVHEELLPHAVSLNETQMVPYANVLAYLTYLLRRDHTLYPTINPNNESNREYRDLLYRANNRLYDFLRSIGLVEAENFSITSERLLHLVGVNIRDERRPPYFRTLDGFQKEFEAYYGVTLAPGVVVPNLQESHIVEHIKRNTEAIECEDSVITTEDLHHQTLMYLSESVADNATTYLQTRFPNHFDQRKRCFVGLRFTNPPLQCDSLAEPFGYDRLKQLRSADYETNDAGGAEDHVNGNKKRESCAADEYEAAGPQPKKPRFEVFDRSVYNDRAI